MGPYGAGHDRDRNGLAGGRWRCDGMVRRAVADRGGCAGRAHRGAVGRDRGRPARRQACGCASTQTSTPRRCRRPRVDLGLAANPAVLQHLSVVFESANPTVVRRFWQRVLDYAPGEDGGLADPLRRDPAIRIRQSTEPRPLRNRIHLDVVRPAAAVEQASLGEASGPFGVCHTDPDGNEVDLVPGNGARREDRDSRLAGGVQRDGVLPHHLADAAA